tara:strand:- start:199 stop:384 length:186 start_codon:yes stop_codon:yes gene_type:complete
MWTIATGLDAINPIILIEESLRPRRPIHITVGGAIIQLHSSMRRVAFVSPLINHTFFTQYL